MTQDKKTDYTAQAKETVEKNRTKLYALAAGAAAIAAVYYKGKSNGEQNFEINLYPDNEPDTKPFIRGATSSKKNKK